MKNAPSGKGVIHSAFLSAIIALIKRFLNHFRQDRVSVYAAQASFFVIISAIPFLSLLSGILRLTMAGDTKPFLDLLAVSIPDTLYTGAQQYLEQSVLSPTVSVLSVSALFLWWSAAKGMGAVREGIQTVYRSPRRHGYFRRMFRSLIHTLFFLVLIVTVIGVFLFGEYLLDLLRSHTSLSIPILDTLLQYRTPLLLAVLTLFFTILFAVTAKSSQDVSHRFWDHVPGALFSALGWSFFSWGYTYYMEEASRPRFLYGNLTGLCLSMLWLYFCMIILLCGAELNKMVFARQRCHTQ